MVGTCLKPIARFKISGSICKIEPALNLVFENPGEYKKQQGSPCRGDLFVVVEIKFNIVKAP